MFDLENWLTWMVILFTITSLVLLTLPTAYGNLIGANKSSNRIQILVLGDIGRSPRMQYHALSIAKYGCQVDLIGYQDSEIHPEILANPSTIKVHALDPTPEYLKTSNSQLFLAFGPLKVLFQIWNLWIVLGYRTKPPRWLLVQNPPSIPTLFIACIISFLRNTRLVIDWHNFGYSILAQRLGNSHPLVQVSYLYEWIFAHFANDHFCVTDAMADILQKEYSVPASAVRTLYDRPASLFQPLNESQRLKFLDGLPALIGLEENRRLGDYQRLTGEIKNGKSKLLVSSTSWTSDEDFGLLLEALIKYSDLAITTHPHLPEILVIITGKGPQKHEFQTQIKKLKAEDKLEMVTIETAFLNMGDYAKLLGSADLGVSLHTSSSGVDLPMKVVDMFGAGLPVVGCEFKAWPELVTDGVNGKGFYDAAGLQAVLMQLFGENEDLLKQLKEGAVKQGNKRWDDEWNPIAGNLFKIC
ncbi:mannosyltransferase [Mycoblastus sanguinarius]|nr:mannosyltransferase [Mycoblastus sanguinarius]